MMKTFFSGLLRMLLKLCLFGYPLHTLRRTGRTEDDGNAPVLQVFQVIFGAGHNLMPGVQQGTVNVQEYSRICTHRTDPPPLSLLPYVS